LLDETRDLTTHFAKIMRSVYSRLRLAPQQATYYTSSGSLSPPPPSAGCGTGGAPHGGWSRAGARADGVH